MSKEIQAWFAIGRVALLLALCGAAAGQESPFTLDQIMSSPFPEGLTAAPSGGALAWVFNAQGRRNVWVAQPPSYKARAITAYANDDGQDIGELSWTPGGKAMVYTRGGDMEMGREYPNPRSFPQGVEQDVWLIKLDGGEPQRLGEGHSPVVSPKGSPGRVAFIYKDQVWLAQIEDREKAAQLIHSKGESGSLRWSPDGSKLAFVSRRVDHSLIGVYDFAAKSLCYLDPSVDRDLAPAWSPDSHQIAFIRIQASKEAFAFGPKRTGQPWSIRVADVASGMGHQVWIAEEGRGSVFRGVVGDSELYWAAENRLVFPWEKDGWTHLYSVPATGGQAELLTPGECEVEHVSLSPDRAELLFSSNQDDADRRHIWRTAVGGGMKPQSVTGGRGIEWSPVRLSGGTGIAFLRSDARCPARPAICQAADLKIGATTTADLPISSGQVPVCATTARDLAPEAIPPDFPYDQLVEPAQVILSSADGTPIHGQLFLPRNIGDGARHPAVVFFHGGSRRQMMLGWWAGITCFTTTTLTL